jgi:hypothetical protein
MIDVARYDDSSDDLHERLVREWTDQFVKITSDRPELKRFAGIIGRVVTINWNNKALVDFQDGGWYDVSPEVLEKVTPEQAKGKYNATVNSAQPHPERQG